MKWASCIKIQHVVAMFLRSVQRWLQWQRPIRSRWVVVASPAVSRCLGPALAGAAGCRGRCGQGRDVCIFSIGRAGRLAGARGAGDGRGFGASAPGCAFGPEAGLRLRWCLRQDPQRLVLGVEQLKKCVLRGNSTFSIQHLTLFSLALDISDNIALAHLAALAILISTSLPYRCARRWRGGLLPKASTLSRSAWAP